MTLRAHNVDFAYRRARPVLRGVDLELTPGRVTAIVGPNASGKSTLLRLLLGRLTPTKGRVTLDARPVHRYPPRELAKRVAFVPQSPSLSFSYTVEQVVRFALLASGRSAPMGVVTRALERLDIADRAHQPWSELSVGLQQRVALARALAQLLASPAGDDRYLLADEPTSALDPRHALAVIALLTELAADGVGVGVVLHDLSIALRVADDALVLDESGRLAADGPVSETLTPHVLQPVFGVRFARVAPKADTSAPPALVPVSTIPAPPPTRE
ncbi:MAG: ABC transporter ATP-binding protein [Phycisphaerales bacterium]